MDDFFSFISKTVIIIPIFILIISLFLKFNQPKKSTTTLNNLYEGQSLLTPTTITTVNNNSFKFDLQGPIVCENLFIQNKKILLKNKLTNYLLNGDCLYIWESGKANGEMRCSLSNYIKMAESYLGNFNIGDLVTNNLMKDLINNKDINLESVVKSCKREAIKDSSIFNIPTKVLFK
ncbi:conserved hypothetical protein [Candidatus Roizmanbacteria bacterium]|nr:conserved hypothetical protein [Candidatus Roizmanbacteria bacterium]